MGEKTSIEWADSTLNTAWGCTKVSAGCENCYMFRLSKIFGKNAENPKPREMKNILRDLKKFRDQKRIIFLNSMTDTFHENFSNELINEWFDLFEAQEHEFIILTKRINRAYNYFKTREVPKNCWIGTSIENKACLHRLTKLKMIDAPILFVSFEPLLEGLGKIDLEGISWVIVGGESDYRNPRPFSVEWAREIRDQCRESSIPFFYKQSGGTRKIKGTWGSNEIDGQKHLEMPILLATKQSTL